MISNNRCDMTSCIRTKAAHQRLRRRRARAGRQRRQSTSTSSCAACRTLVDDLREIRRAARELAPIEPPARPGRASSGRLRESSTDAPAQAGYPVSWTDEPHVALAAVWVGALPPLSWLLRRRAQSSGTGCLAPRESTPVEETERAPTAQSVEAELRQAEEHYEKAIKGLEQIANDGKGRARSANTPATLQKNLAVDRSGDQREPRGGAIAADSEPAQQSLLDSFKTKIGLLQDTVALINEMRKGNEAGAARIVSGLQTK